MELKDDKTFNDAVKRLEDFSVEDSHNIYVLIAGNEDGFFTSYKGDNVELIKMIISALTRNHILSSLIMTAVYNYIGELDPAIKSFVKRRMNIRMQKIAEHMTNEIKKMMKEDDDNA